MKKVIVITEEGRGGGPVYRMQVMAKALENYFQTVLVVPKNAKKLRNTLESKGLDYEPLFLHPLSKNLWSLLCYFLFFVPELYLLIRLFKKQQPDLVHCNGSWQIKGVLAAHLCNIPTIWHMNDAYQPKMVRWLFKSISKFASAYIFASNRTKSYYSKINPQISSKPFWIIPAPVDTSVFKKGAKANLPGEGFCVLTVGYVNKNKGLLHLIRAAKILKEKSTGQYRFFVAGPVLKTQKTYFNQLQNEIEKAGLDNIVFLGYRSDIPALLSACDLYICASIYESSPMSVWEALSCSCPVLSTDVGDVKSILEEYSCGWIVPPGNPEAIAEKLSFLYNHPDALSSAAKNAATAAGDCFDAEKLSLQYQYAYNALL